MIGYGEDARRATAAQEGAHQRLQPQRCRCPLAYRAPIFVCLILTLPLRPTWAADGQDIAANGNGQGAPACSACHGAKGEGNPENGYPRLAGMNAGYVVHQLSSFAEGTRSNEIMEPIAKALTPEEREVVALFYDNQVATKASEEKASDDKLLAQGAKLASDGDWAKGLPGCAQCHGPAGQGIGTAFPALAGQPASYIQAQFAAWKDGKRTNDPLGLMAGIIGKLSDQDVEAVAAYYASLPVPQKAAHKETKP